MISKNYSVVCKGMCILMVILQHWQQHTHLSLDFFQYLGMYGCAGFFFLSGYGLFKSYTSDTVRWIDSFWSQRFLNIMLPFVLANVLYMFESYFYSSVDLNYLEVILGVTGIKLYNSHFWFMHAILCLYVCMYVCSKLNVLPVFSIIALFMTSIFYVFFNGKMLGISSLFFPLGVWMSFLVLKYPSISFYVEKHYYNIIITSALCGLFFYMAWYLNLCSIILIPISLFLFVLLMIFLRSDCNGHRMQIFISLGSLSFYLYLMNRFSLVIMDYLSLETKWSVLLYVFVNVFFAFAFMKSCFIIKAMLHR